MKIEPGQNVTLPDGRKGKLEFVGMHFCTVRIGKKLVTVKVGDLAEKKVR